MAILNHLLPQITDLWAAGAVSQAGSIVKLHKTLAALLHSCPPWKRRCWKGFAPGRHLCRMGERPLHCEHGVWGSVRSARGHPNVLREGCVGNSGLGINRKWERLTASGAGLEVPWSWTSTGTQIWLLCTESSSFWRWRSTAHNTFKSPKVQRWPDVNMKRDEHASFYNCPFLKGGRNSPDIHYRQETPWALGSLGTS